MTTPPAVTHISIRLQRLRDLFEAPVFDPFEPASESLSGIERIFREMRRRAHRAPARVTLLLPAAVCTPDIQPACADAVRRLCDVEIAEIDDELASIRWEGGRTLLVGMLTWAACLFLALFFEALPEMAEFPRLFFSEGLIIVGWVALWYPSEIILYEWWLQNRDKKVYQRIKAMEIRVEPD